MIGGPPSFDRVRGLREVLTATGAGIYLATHVAGPIPAETMAAIHESDEMELRVGRAGPDRSDDLEQRHKEAVAVAAAAVKTSPERILLMHGAPEAARAVALEVLAGTDAGARILVLAGIEADILAAVRQVATALGVSIEVVEEAPRILAADVAMVLMAHVDADGHLAAVGPLADAAHKAGAKLVLDAGMSAGALDFSVDDLGADVVIAGTHRWLLGPDSMAIVWLAPALGDGIAERLRASTGVFGRGALLALARSVGWLLMYVELPWAIARTEELAERLYLDLAAIDGLELMADPAAHGAVAAFRISDWDAVQAVEELGRSVFAIVEADAEADLIRASVAAWNREEELDRFVERVAELAEHTPESLPRKPSLTVLSGPIEPANE